jgi:hypothetical protein
VDGVGVGERAVEGERSSATEGERSSSGRGATRTRGERVSERVSERVMSGSMVSVFLPVGCNEPRSASVSKQSSRDWSTGAVDGKVSAKGPVLSPNRPADVAEPKQAGGAEWLSCSGFFEE